MSSCREILLGSPRGFCAGVTGAIKTFERTLAKVGKPVYILHELVHNNHVTEKLKSDGAIFVDDLAEVPEKATILFGAHGVTPEIETAAKAKQLNIVDATCPLVKKLQNKAAAISPNHDLIIFGSANHPETQGVAGHSGTKKVHILSAVSEIDELPENLNNAVFISQTTRNDEEIKLVAGKLKEKYPDLTDFSGACNAVFERQQAVRKLAEKCDLVIIAGSSHSSNAKRLAEIAAGNGRSAYLADTPEEVPAEEIAKAQIIGIASGASTPEICVENMVSHLVRSGFAAPETIPDYPQALKNMSVEELEVLAAKIRQKIVHTVANNGGHLSAALGCVELIIALHKVFDIPENPLIFDVGHQAHAHKLLSGRWADFDTICTSGGLSEFPNPAESPSDTGVSGHAGSAISLAIGIADGRKKSGTPGKVIALTGDASIWNGISLEGLNSAAKTENLVIILNDNKMAIAPNVGAFSRYLNKMISNRRYNRFRDALIRAIAKLPFHDKFHKFASHIDDMIKYTLMPPGTIFQELGIRYIGPVNGHSIEELLPILEWIKDANGPILLHVLTTKGKGCDFAEKHPTLYHGVGKFDPETGVIKKSGQADYSHIFGAKLVALAEKFPQIEAVTAAMPDGTGLREFMDKYPERCHDVGIAEEHALVYSAGLAIAGRRPVCVLYSTFSQRALDCFYHDIVLAKLPVILALDRCGIVPDGPTHHGIYDLGFLQEMPGVEILAPSNAQELAMMLDYLMTKSIPAVIRYPRGYPVSTRAVPEIQCGKAEIIREGSDVAFFALGAEVDTALAAADILEREHHISSAVINARFVAPFDHECAVRFADRPIVTVEDHCVRGGLGSALLNTLADKPHQPVLLCGWPEKIICHGETAKTRKIHQLDADGIADRTVKFLASLKR